MTFDSSQDFVATLLKLEPFLGNEGKRSIQALPGLIESFPGQTLPEIEKSVRSLLQNSRTSVPAMAERAKRVLTGGADETATDIVKDAKKLDTAGLASLGRNLGISLSGTKAKMAEQLERWIESRGQFAPKSPDEEIAAEGRRQAAPLAPDERHDPGELRRHLQRRRQRPS